MKASDALSGTDPGQAADLARRALDLTTEHHPLRGPLVARAAILLNAAARSEEAQAFADSALRQALPAGQEAEVRLSIASLFSISPEVRAESCRRALDLAEVPPSQRARLLALLLYNLVVAGRPGQAQQLLKEAERAVEETGDTAARFTLKLAQSPLHYTRGHFEEALALIDDALRSGAEVGEDPRLWLARHRGRCGRGPVTARAHVGPAHRGAGRRMGPGRPRQHQPGASAGRSRATRATRQRPALTSSPVNDLDGFAQVDPALERLHLGGGPRAVARHPPAP